MADPKSLTPEQFFQRYGNPAEAEAETAVSLSPEEFTQLYGQTVPEQEVKSNLNLAQKAWNAWGLASSQLFAEPVAAGLDLIGMEEAGDKLRARLGELQKEIHAKVPELAKEYDVSDLADPSFYLTKGVSIIPTLLAFGAGGAGVAKLGARGAAALAARAGLTGKALNAAKAIGGATTAGLASRTMEGAVEAANAYNQLVNEGTDRTEAAQAAAKVFRNNYALTGLDAAQFAAATFKLPPALSKGMAKWAARAIKGGLAAGTEGAEELYQGYISDTATRFARGEKEVDGITAKGFWDYATKAPLWQQEEFVLGALFGLGFDIGGGAMAKFGKNEQELRQSIRKDPKAVIDELKNTADEMKDDNSRRETVAQAVYNKPFQELDDEQKSKIDDRIATQKEDDEAAKIDEAVTQPVAPAEPAVDFEKEYDAIAQEVFNKTFAELGFAQKSSIKKKYADNQAKAEEKRLDDAIKRRLGLKPEEKAAKAPKEKPIAPLSIEPSAPPPSEAPAPSPAAPTAPSAAEGAAARVEPEAKEFKTDDVVRLTGKEGIYRVLNPDVAGRVRVRGPRGNQFVISREKVAEIPESEIPANVRGLKIGQAVKLEGKEGDYTIVDPFAKNGVQVKGKRGNVFVVKPERIAGVPKAIEGVAVTPTAPREGQGQPTHREFQDALNIFNRAISPVRGRKFSVQQEIVSKKLADAGIHPVIIDELVNARRAIRPRESYDDRNATTRPGRIERAIEPPTPALKGRVDAIANAVVDFRNKEADLIKAKEEIIQDIRSAGGEVVVDTDTGTMTISIRTGKVRTSESDQAIINQLRREAAEAGAFSLATIGQGFEVAAAPEKIKQAAPLPQGTFKQRALEFLRRNEAAKAAEKTFKAAKESARNDLIDYYLGERVAGQDTPRAIRGTAKDGTLVEVLTRRNRSEADPDLIAGGRDFAKEIQAQREKAKARSEKEGPRGEPYLEARKAGKAKIEEAKKRGSFVAAPEAEYTAGKREVTFEDSTYDLRKGVKEIPDLSAMDRLQALRWLSRNAIQRQTAEEILSGNFADDARSYKTFEDWYNSTPNYFTVRGAGTVWGLTDADYNTLTIKQLYDLKKSNPKALLRARFSTARRGGVAARTFGIDKLVLPENPEQWWKSVKSGGIVAAPASPYSPAGTEATQAQLPNQLQAIADLKKPYEPTYKKRPDASPKTDRLAKGAVESLGDNRKPGRVWLANAINAEARAKGAVSLVGKEVRTSDDLATLAQVYRDPRWETLRYIFVKGGKIVHVSGLSNRLPSSAATFPVAGDNAGIAWLEGMMERTGADGFYMIHNHPSGVSEPSSADVEQTQKIAKQAKGFQGHVVIDSNEYSTIDASGKRETVKKFFGEEKLLVPSIEHEALGKNIRYAEDMAKIGAQYKAPKGWVTLIGETEGKVSAMMEVSEETLRKKSGSTVRDFARNSGAQHVYLVTSHDYMKSNTAFLEKAIRKGFVRDAVSVLGDSVQERMTEQGHGYEIPQRFNLGVKLERGRVVEAAEIKRARNKQIYSPEFKRWFGDWENEPEKASKVVDDEGKPLVVYHGTGVNIEKFKPSSTGLIYFASNPNYAMGYAANRSYGEKRAPTIYPAFVKITNPLDARSLGSDNIKLDDLFNMLPKLKDSKFGMHLSDSFRGEAYPFWVLVRKNEELVDSIKLHGYDGIIQFENSNNPQLVYAAFEPNQIKSAIGNIGAFDPEITSIVAAPAAEYGPAKLSREEFLNIGRTINEFVANKEAVNKLLAEEKETLSYYVDTLNDFKKLSQQANLTPQQQSLLNIASRDIRSPEGKAILERVSKLLKENQEVPPSFLDKLAEWTASMYLWRLSSIGKGVMSNLARQIIKYPELKMAAWFNKGIARKNQVIQTRFDEEAMIDFQAAWMSDELKQSARKALDIMLEQPGAESESEFFKREQIKRRAIQGKKGTIIRAGLNAQGALDVLIRQPAMAAAIARYGYREAKRISKNKAELIKAADTVKSGIRAVQQLQARGEKVPENLQRYADILEKAKKDAQSQTFQEELSGIAKDISGLRRYPLVRLFIPFFNTYMNIMRQAYARTPFALANPRMLELMKKSFKKKVNAEEAGELADRASQIAFGTGTFLTVIALLHALSDDEDDIITGDYDPKTISDKPMGWQANSIKVGDTYVSYQGLEPFGTMFRAWGNIKDSKKAGIAAAIEGLASTTISNPMTDEVHDVMKDIEEGNVDKFFIDMLASAALPGLMQDVSRIVDPTVRRKDKDVAGTYTMPGLAAVARETAEEQFVSRVGIPGVSTTLPPTVDVFGEELRPQTRGERALKTVTGIAVSRQKEDKARRELRRLGMKFNVKTATHEGVKLMVDETIKLNQIVGAKFHQQMLVALRHHLYKNATDDQKKTYLKALRDKLVREYKKGIERSPDFKGRAQTSEKKSKAERRLKEQLLK